MKCVTSSEACMCHAYTSASNLTKQLPLCWGTEHLILRKLVGSKSNFRSSAIASVVYMERVMVIGQLSRGRHCQAARRGTD